MSVLWTDFQTTRHSQPTKEIFCSQSFCAPASRWINAEVCVCLIGGNKQKNKQTNKQANKHKRTKQR